MQLYKPEQGRSIKLSGKPWLAQFDPDLTRTSDMPRILPYDLLFQPNSIVVSKITKNDARAKKTITNISKSGRPAILLDALIKRKIIFPILLYVIIEMIIPSDNVIIEVILFKYITSFVLFFLVRSWKCFFTKMIGNKTRATEADKQIALRNILLPSGKIFPIIK